jgi:uncharacterized protein YecA (UPF0149 family)
MAGILAKLRGTIGFTDACQPGGVMRLHMHRTSKAQEFRDHAEDCRLQAERCSTETEKEQWSRMGEEWLRMARDAETWRD